MSTARSIVSLKRVAGRSVSTGAKGATEARAGLLLHNDVRMAVMGGAAKILPIADLLSR